MDCASFENRLTELLGGEADAEARHDALAGLRRHVEDCPECVGAAALVELAEAPPQQRDPVELPPDSYWAGFNASVTARLDAEPAAAPSGAGRRRLAVAASIVLALAAGWSLRGWVDPGDPNAPQLAVDGSSEDPEWSRLEELIRQASPEELAEALRGLPGEWSGIAASGWTHGENELGGDWMPDIDELNETDQTELMDWLDQVESSERRSTS
ncbi:MAG: hypothetical protein GTN89_12300 [Acidobacteria bacterium]|nr:hypothetical protein [Acidobacteriota bacterium]NIM63262.1 hypothetical protein [Acidobacteriota bacterium]NIO60055.1 hypothetical protein [Acidobacteriota bacterium]NIQ31126.1 hypothetical protein [Acidobacteriota bacterium]NIQ86235.1 hypothetical protein [Acidobacteriota bacterium]